MRSGTLSLGFLLDWVLTSWVDKWKNGRYIKNIIYGWFVGDSFEYRQWKVPCYEISCIDTSFPDLGGSSCLWMLLMSLATLVSWFPGPLVHNFPLSYISSTLEAGLNRMPCLPDLELFWSLLSFAFLSWTLNNLQDPTRFCSSLPLQICLLSFYFSAQ